MYQHLKVVAIVPAFNEEQAIGKVVTELLALGEGETKWIDQVIVCDNASYDKTAMIAKQAGALVVRQDQAGYGIACLTAMRAMPACDVVLFVDGDDSCYLKQTESLLEGINAGADITIGSRVLGNIERGALTVPQRFGNQLATLLIRLIWGAKITDLGPFRAIRRVALDKLNMQDPRFGWTVEMQIKAIQQGLVMREYAVDSKVRIGKSKISGTLKGVIGAGIGIIGTIIKIRYQQNQARQCMEKKQ